MALRASSSNKSASSSAPSVPVPTGVAADDIVIIVQSNDGSTNPAVPSGFTVLNAILNFGFDGQCASVAWKRATGADTGSYTWGAAVGGPWAAQAYAFSGRDTTNPPVSATTKSSNAANPSPVSIVSNAVTVVSGDDLLYIGCPDLASGTADSLTTVPSGMTLVANTVQTITSIGSAEQDNATTTGSTTATGVWTSAAIGYAAWLIRVPSGGGATPQNITPTAAGISEADNAVTAPTLLAAESDGISEADLALTAATFFSASASAISEADLTVTAGVVNIAPAASAVTAATAPLTAPTKLTAAASTVAAATLTVTAPTGYQLVGSVGAVATAGGGSAVTPAFGQATTAGNLLVCSVVGRASSTFPTTPSGWTVLGQANDTTSTGATATIFGAIAAGGDTPPTIAAATGVTWYVQLREMAGNPATLTGIVDQTASASGTTSPHVATAPGTDGLSARGGMSASIITHSPSAAGTLTESLNNGTLATTTNTGASVVGNYAFGHVLSTTSNASADAYTFTFTTTPVAGVSVFISLVPAGAAGIALSPTANGASQATATLTAPALLAPTASAVTAAASPVSVNVPLAPSAAGKTAATLTVTAAGARALTPTAAAVSAALATVKTTAPLTLTAAVVTAATGLVFIAPIITTTVPASSETPITTIAVPASGETLITTIPVPASGETLITTSAVPASGESGITTVPVPASGETPITTTPTP